MLLLRLPLVLYTFSRFCASYLLLSHSNASAYLFSFHLPSALFPYIHWFLFVSLFRFMPILWLFDWLCRVQLPIWYRLVEHISRQIKYTFEMDTNLLWHNKFRYPFLISHPFAPIEHWAFCIAYDKSLRTNKKKSWIESDFSVALFTRLYCLDLDPMDIQSIRTDKKSYRAVCRQINFFFAILFFASQFQSSAKLHSFDIVTCRISHENCSVIHSDSILKYAHCANHNLHVR